MKKGFKLCTALLSGLMVLSAATGCSCNKDDDPPAKVELPAARKDTEECKADNQKFSLTCSTITAENFDTYAERDDVMYVDLRDSAKYIESHLQNFEMVQFYTNIYGTGTQLFNSDYTPRYAESVALLEEMFPKNKTIFFMCQSGGRVADMMKIMELHGWDMSKIYNIGGMNQYGESKYRVDGYDPATLTLATAEVTGTAAAEGKYNDEIPAARKDTEACKTDAQKFSLTCSNVTSENLDDYAKMEDVIYVDLREANKYIESHLHGFSMIEFYGKIYGSGTQLFKEDYSARYVESVTLLEEMFPKDKTIFLMCQSGGRVADMMKIMEKYGWNMDNVYNIGGMNQYGDSEYRIDNVDLTQVHELTYKTGTFTETSFGHEYTTDVVVGVDADEKIRYVGVTGECSDVDTWGENSKWYNGKAAFLKGLYGKTLADLQTIAGTGEKAAASGNDVVAGATLSSNRVYTAIIKALTPATPAA